MRRRDFIAALSSAAAVWPLATRAQQPKRVGVLMDGVATASVGQTNLSSFVQGLRKLGWVDGENIRIEVRWNAGDRSLIEAYASDLVGLFKPDVLLAASTANLAALQRATSTIPIVGKWADLLKQMSPSIVRATTLHSTVCPHGNRELGISEAGDVAARMRQVWHETLRDRIGDGRKYRSTTASSCARCALANKRI
jgi:hypothetical protein